MRVICRKCHIPTYWQVADGCFVPKEENSAEIKQFRTISLLNVEGKIFLALLARRITSYIVDNEYVDTSVQRYLTIDKRSQINERRPHSCMVRSG